MELFKIYFSLLALQVSMIVYADDFATARQKINQAKPNISYDTFCLEKKSGEDKVACRIKDVPTIGFLVCKTPKVEEVNCSVVIKTEVENIKTVSSANIKTVTISTPPIDGVKCGEDQSLTCSGFLEEWITSETGRFKQVRDHIDNNTVANLINDVKNFTTTTGLSATAADLKKIKNYMMIDPNKNKYRQICDLQGFFLIKGGFLVADVPAIENVSISDPCWPGEPTTQKVLDALNEMISEFSPSLAPSNGSISRSGLNFNAYLLFGSHFVTVIVASYVLT
ncbi:unnamed protein product [Porites evermanni]|uniref:Uncharacterized protein n=1 Tax=Porites evermanni TaxID=104178 RepID=A0ABN8QB76_9CNID|nr:unnamed protein product [Porites evermanni]